jgi:hypothetical protein
MLVEVEVAVAALLENVKTGSANIARAKMVAARNFALLVLLLFAMPYKELDAEDLALNMELAGLRIYLLLVASVSSLLGSD